MPNIKHTLRKRKGYTMISYKPFWDTLKNKGISTYTIRNHGISGSTLERIKNNESISTNTIDMLCDILGCAVSDIIVHEKNSDNE